MADFNLGKAKCELKAYAEGILTEYIYYMREHSISPLNEKDNQYVKNYYEVNNLSGYPLALCKSENDINKIKIRLNELRELIK